VKIFTDPQGSDAWKEARRGVLTGSKAKDMRDYKAPTAAQKKEGLMRGEPSSKLIGYARDTAREIVGGYVPPIFTNDAMRTGTEQEPIARRAFERRTGDLVLEAGFITTDDARFGVSVDGFIGDDGIIEIKTAVSSNTLFDSFVTGDVSEYRDQCLMAMWLTGRKFVKVVLWAYDLEAMRIVTITRDDNEIEELERDLLQFKARVDANVKALTAALEIAKGSL
jgi:exodeoxyribonuclease (lambda-induced)